jgi:amidophosphoribosyltransferase
VHFRITSPPTRWPCRYGIDTPTREELIASTQDPEEIRRFVEADSLAYLSLEGMLRCLSGPPDTYCTACWSGEYPEPIGSERRLQAELFPIRMDEGG